MYIIDSNYYILTLFLKFPSHPYHLHFFPPFSFSCILILFKNLLFNQAHCVMDGLGLSTGMWWVTSRYNNEDNDSSLSLNLSAANSSVGRGSSL